MRKGHEEEDNCFVRANGTITNNSSLEMSDLVQNEYKSFTQDAVQKGRLPRSPLEGSMVDQLVGMQQQQQQHINGGVYQNNQYVSSYTNMLLRADNLQRIHHQQQQQQQQQQQPPSQPHQIQQQPPSQVHPINVQSANQTNIYDAATKLLQGAVEWARNVPLFSALPTTDQLALLKFSWSELYILSTSQHCSAYQINVRNLTPQHHKQSNLSSSHQQNQHRKPLQKGGTLVENSCKVFEDLVEKFRLLQTDPAEFSCLKALVLFNPDSPGITDPSLIESLQDKAQNALQEYLRHHSSPNYSHRFGKLLLRLPALSLIRPTTLESLFFPRLVDHQSIDNLVTAMLFYGAQNIPNNGPVYHTGNNAPVCNVPNGMSLNVNGNLNGNNLLGIFNNHIFPQNSSDFQISYNNNNLQNGLQNTTNGSVQTGQQFSNTGVFSLHQQVNTAATRPDGEESKKEDQKFSVKTESPGR